MQIFKRNIKTGLTAFAAACLIAPALAAAAPSIVNGSFEAQTNYGTSGDGSIDFTFYPDGWTPLVAGGEGLQSWGNAPSPDGGKYWGTQYLIASVWNGHTMFDAGGLSQTVNGLTVGQTYQISFYTMANPAYNKNVPAYWAVTFGGSTANGTTVTASTPGTWSQDKLNFVATSSSQTLTFSSVFLNAMPGATPEILNLDGISISAVPEPSTWGLMLAGFTALGLCLRRRRAS